MKDFEPSDMLRLQLNSKAEEFFYEEVDELPAKVRGAFYVEGGSKKKIDFEVIGPDQ